jgi:hypothetical protein
MFRLRHLRFATIVLFAVAAVSLTVASARAFSQQNGGAGEGGNSFADPDDQVSNMFGFDQGAEPSGLNGSVQLGRQHWTSYFTHFQINSLTSPSDPLSRPSN